MNMSDQDRTFWIMFPHIFSDALFIIIGVTICAVVRAGVIIANIHCWQTAAGISNAFADRKADVLSEAALKIISSYAQAFCDPVSMKIDLFCACLHMNLIS